MNPEEAKIRAQVKPFNWNTDTPKPPVISEEEAKLRREEADIEALCHYSNLTAPMTDQERHDAEQFAAKEARASLDRLLKEKNAEMKADEKKIWNAGNRPTEEEFAAGEAEMRKSYLTGELKQQMIQGPTATILLEMPIKDALWFAQYLLENKSIIKVATIPLEMYIKELHCGEV